MPILHSLNALPPFPSPPLPSPPFSSPPLPFPPLLLPPLSSPNSRMQAMAKEPAKCPPEALDSEDMLFLLYTSGSTGKQRAWSTLRLAISYMRHLNMEGVCASVHVSVCMSELCGVCHPCDLSWCLTVTRGTSMRVWLTLAGSPATHIWSTVPCAMESPLFCLRALHSIQTQVRWEGRDGILGEGARGGRGKEE